MLLRLKDIIDERLCYEKFREMRWAEGTKCPYCGSLSHRRQGQHPKYEHRHCYQCKACQRHYDDLTNTIFQDLQPSLKTWVLCLNLLALGVEESKIAWELGISENDCRAMQHYLREQKGENALNMGWMSALVPTPAYNQRNATS